jgi:hypothetical protein
MPPPGYPYDYFTYGREQAGHGWYKPGPPGWLTILAGAVQGAGQGLARGIPQMREQSLTAKLNERVPGTPEAPEGPEQLFSESPQGHQPSVPYASPYTAEQQRQMRIARDRMRLMQLYSSRTLKDDISRDDEQRSLREVLATPTYRYRYRDEPAGTQGRIGPMAEEVPARWQSRMPNGLVGIKMPVMLGALHAATRALGREVQTLKERLHG